MANIQAIYEQFMKLKGANERLQGLTTRHDIYPAIDPQSAFNSKSFAGKVVLITGASKGLGPVIATFYARAGAKLALVARTASALDSVKKQIQATVDGAEVLTFTVDVKDTAAAAKVVQDTVDSFGRIDVVVANAGVTLPHDGTTIGDRDVGQWWNTMEVNLLGTLNFVAPSLKHLSKANGHVVAISSMGAQLRNIGASDYAVSKFALNRLMEFVALEYSNVPAFAVHPGAVWTEMAKGTGLPKEIFLDTPELASATILALTSGKFDWLSGRFIDSTLDLGELEQLKDKILEKDALVAKLVLL
ncbi:NAD-P-binding protein [Peniophora sp. CONT]|nr:NAD-P-binding protein [Peniophora sp. CONT]